MSRKDSIKVVQFVDDGTLLSGSESGQVLSWDLATGTARPVRAMKQEISAIALDPAGSRAALVAWSYGGHEVVVGELGALDAAPAWRPTQSVTTAALRDGGELVVGGFEGICRVAPRGGPGLFNAGQGGVNRFARAGTRVFGIARDEHAVELDLGGTGAPSVNVLPRPEDPGDRTGTVESLAMSADGRRAIAVRTVDERLGSKARRELLLWYLTAAPPRVEAIALPGDFGSLRRAAIGLDASIAIVGGEGKRLLAIDLEAREVVRVLHVGAPVLALDARGARIAVGVRAGILVLDAAALIEGRAEVAAFLAGPDRALPELAFEPVPAPAAPEPPPGPAATRSGGGADLVLDAECVEGPGSYRELLLEFARASRGAFAPVQIHERHDEDAGEVRLRFQVEGRRYAATLELMNDWADLNVVETINQALAEGGEPRRFLELPAEGQFAPYRFAVPDAPKKKAAKAPER